MGHSSLASYFAYSPNHYDGRKGFMVDTLTPHYMSGDCTVEACGEIFAQSSRQASSNYGIGSDGRIAVYVDEDDAAWTSGSWRNDCRAITFECANLEDDSLTGACWDSLVALCADICRRYGFKGVQYTGEADHSRQRDGYMLLTMHRWFQKTDCPGDWFASRFQKLADDINEALGGPQVPRLTVRQALAETMLHLVTHDAHGYSQLAREGDGTVETLTLSDGTTVRVHGGDFDCSEAIRSCLAALGLVAWGYWESYMWTGNEPEVLAAAGFVEIPLSEAAEGDVLLRSGHTEMCVIVGGELMDAGFRRSETHGIHGEQGDQDGLEGCFSPHPAYAWEHCYRYDGPEREGAGRPVDKLESGQTEDEMKCIIQPNGEGYLAYFDGQKLHPLAHPDEAEALNMVYKQTHGGASIPSFKLGEKNAPWATRLLAALNRTMDKV